MQDFFDEIVGYEDIKEELRIISDMLNNSDVYRKLGASFNNGVILIGDPGTGKTTLANCLVKSLNRKAFVCRKKASDGEFVKQIVDTFTKAKESAPSIILLDDLDKFVEDDKEDIDAEEFVTVQTCMDEINGADVFVIATANNPQKIPSSLGRQGRLGKIIHVHIPKEQEAERIIGHYLRKTGSCDGLDEKSIVRLLNNETCATLESVISCAAMKAAYKRQNKVSMDNIVDACLELVYDAPASSYKLSEEVTRKVAYHEAAHAVVSELLDPGSVNIISVRENYGKHGFVIYYRPNEKTNCSVSYHENMIKTSLAGKAATELIFGETDMGVDSDLENAFRRAKELVDDKCMFGFNSWTDVDYINTYAAEERTRAVGMLLERYYLETKKLLAEHKGLLDMMASELISRNTLLYSDVQRICSCFR